MEQQNIIGKNEYWKEQDKMTQQLFEFWQKQPPVSLDEAIRQHKEWEIKLKTLERQSDKN